MGTARRYPATVLFIDIVGSTERAVALGDRRWREIQEAYHTLVRRELAHYRGREIDIAGDGFLATFDGPARGIRCARAVSDAVRRLGIEIRAGLHTGECKVSGDRVRGNHVGETQHGTLGSAFARSPLPFASPFRSSRG